MPYYLASWTGSGTRLDPWRPVVDQPGSQVVDLRPDGGASPDGNGLNACLLYLPAPSADSRLTLLADANDDILPPAVQAKLRATLGAAPFASSRLDAIVAELLISPPLNRWPRLYPNSRGVYEIWRGPDRPLWAGVSLGSVPAEALMGMAAGAFRMIGRREFVILAGSALVLLCLRAPSFGAIVRDQFNRADETPLAATGRRPPGRSATSTWPEMTSRPLQIRTTCFIGMPTRLARTNSRNSPGRRSATRMAGRRAAFARRVRP